MAQVGVVYREHGLDSLAETNVFDPLEGSGDQESIAERAFDLAERAIGEWDEARGGTEDV